MRTEDETGYPILDDQNALPIFDKIVVKGCKTCGTPFPPKIKYYPHTDGWKIPGESQTMWLFIECPNCGYQWSLWRLGYGRTDAETEEMRGRCEIWQNHYLIKNEAQRKKILKIQGLDENALLDL